MPNFVAATWNVNSLTVRLEQVLDWLARTRPDALFLQETKVRDELFPQDAFDRAGYRAVFTGQQTFNGVALLTRRDTTDAPERTLLNLPGCPDEQKRFCAARVRPFEADEPLWLASAYVPNGMEPGSWKFLYKLDWLTALTRTMKGILADSPRVILGGDFNIAPKDTDLWSADLWRGRILTTNAERGALARLAALGLFDAQRLLPMEPGTFSWWDYRAQGFESNHGLRIDLMLISDALRGALRKVKVDTAPRAAERPSDHAPVVMTLDLDGAYPAAKAPESALPVQESLF